MGFLVAGTGSALPEMVVDNARLSAFLDTSDEWIRTRTGISERHVLAGESLAGLAARAGRQATAQAGFPPGDLDLILCATMSADEAIPSLACRVQEALGASCTAFDINAACSGFVYALDVAEGYLCRGRARRILVVAADAMSRVVDWKDRSTCVLFGDGAGAVALVPGEGLLSIRLTARGNAAPLSVPGPKGNSPFHEDPFASPFLAMDGQEVFRFAVSSVARDIREALSVAGIAEADVDFVLLHQANMRILAATASRLSIQRDKYVHNIGRYGNTSAASIPLLLDEMNRGGALRPGALLVLSAFGGGLTTGTCVIRWGQVPEGTASGKIHTEGGSYEHL